VKELAKAQTATAEEGKARSKTEDSPAARKGRAALQVLSLPGSKAERVVQLRVRAAPGVENFYVLRIDEPPPSNDKNQQNQQDKQDKQDEDKKDEQKPDDKKDDENKKDPQDEKKDPADPKEQEQKDQQERQRRQMERNDHNPHNLEAEEAMRRSPFKNSRPDKDW
jgi:hypothetical protein